MKSKASFPKPTCAALFSTALWIFSAVHADAQIQLGATALSDQSVRLAWPEVTGLYQLESAATVDQGWQNYATAPQIVGSESVIQVPGVESSRFFRLRLVSPDWLTVLSTSPAQGETGVAVTRETIFRFSDPLAPDAMLDVNRLFAFAGGRKILSRTELSSDRKTATLFYTENLPADARVEVTFDGAGLFDFLNLPIDLDGDGVSGGAAKLMFETVSTVALATTGVEGRVFASEKNPDGSNRPLQNVTITVDGMEETLRTTTDANGFFRLLPSPTGRFFVSVDGRTAQGSVWPGGAYYPFVGKAWDAVPGRTNNLAGGSGVVFLPLIQADALQAISVTGETKITVSPSALQTNPELAGVEILVPANSLFSDNGARGGKVGIAPVAPDRLPEPLPPGLNLPLVITVQTDGARNFDQPVPIRLPNLPDPVTGFKLPPGAKTVLWSFNHDTGRWEPQGTMTVTEDGNFAVTDPGVGIRQPGWHGSTPGSGGSGPGSGGGGGNGDCEDANANGFCDSDDEKRCETDKLKFQFAAVDALIGFVPTPDMGPLGSCLNGLATSGSQAVRDCSIDTNSCRETVALKFMDFSIDCGLSFVPQTKNFKTAITWIKRVKGLFDAGLAYANLDLCTGGGGGGKKSTTAEAAVMVGGFSTAGNPFLQQYEVETRLHTLLGLVYGNSKWAEIDPQEWPYSAAIITAVREATQPASPEGKTASAAERASILALPRPDLIETGDVTALINRMEGLMNNQGGSFDTALIQQESDALRAIMAQVIAAGWQRAYDGWRRGAALARQVATTGGVIAGAGNLASSPQSLPNYPMPARSLHFALIDEGTGFEQRGRLNSLGRFDGIILRPSADYMVVYFDSTTFRAGATMFKSAEVGRITFIPGAQMARLPGLPDTDHDGLADIAEKAIGTFSDNADSDDDGISDSAEILNGTNPGDGQLMGLGAVASRETPGTAVELDTVDDFAIVADSAAGIAVFNVANPLAPVLASQTAPPTGIIETVVAAGEFVAAAPGTTTASTSRVYLYRLARDGKLALIGNAAVGAVPRSLAAAGRYVYAPSVNASLGGIAVIQINNGSVIRHVPTGGATAPRTVVIDGDVLWVLLAESLASFRIRGDDLLPLGSVPALAVTTAPLERVPELFAANGRVYVGEFEGFRVFDGSNPSAPVLLHDPATTQGAIHDFALNGTGFMLPVTSFAGSDTLFFSIYDVRQDRATNFLASFDTPGNTRAVTLHRGYALTADGAAGLAVVNFRDPDGGSTPPTVTVLPFPSAGETGQEAEENFYVSTVTGDDVQVRDVEFHVDGRLSGLSAKFPFATTLRAPARVAGKTNFRLRAKATDTGGNSAWSSEAIITLLPDMTPPRLLTFNPAHNSVNVRGSISTLTAIFDSVMNEGTAQQALTLTEAGGDGNFGTADDAPITGASFNFSAAERTATWKFAKPLRSGKYRAQFAASATDLNGNALANPATIDFSIPAARGISANPADKDVFLTGTLDRFEIRFDERLTVSTLNPGSLKVLRADQTEVAGASVTAMPDASGAVLQLPEKLGNGTYRLVFNSNLLDVYGSPLVTNFPVVVIVKGSSYWKSDIDGLWATAANWSNGVPILNDHVIIDRGNANPIVTLRSFATLTDFRTEEEMFIDVGSLTVRENAIFNAPFRMRDLAGNIKARHIEFNSSASLNGSVEPGVEAIFQGPALITSDTSLRGGRSRFFGGLEVRGTTSLGGHMLVLEPGTTNLIGENQIQFGSVGSRFIISPGASLELSNSLRGANHFIHNQGGSSGRVENNGVMFKRGTATNNIIVPLINTGSFSVDQGKTTLGNGSENSGLIHIAAGARLDLPADFQLLPAGRITGGGYVRIPDGAVFNGSYEVTGTNEVSAGGADGAFNAPIQSAAPWIITGRATFNGPTTELTGPVRLNSGNLILNSPGNTVLSDLRVEQASMLGGTGRVVFAAQPGLSNTLSIVDSLTVRFEFPVIFPTNFFVNKPAQADLTTDSRWTGGSLSGNFQFPPGVTLNLDSDFGGVSLYFPIEGNLRKTNASSISIGSLTGAILTNRSLIEILGGTATHNPLSDAIFVQEAGELVVGSGATFSTAALLLRGGTLSGAGTIRVRVGTSNRGCRLAATVSPQGTLNFVGEGFPNWIAGSRTIIDIGATAQDQIVAERTLDIDGGTLEIRTEAGFDPALAQEFTIMTGSGRTGTFPEVIGTTLPNGKRYRVVYEAQAVKLRVEAQ